MYPASTRFYESKIAIRELALVFLSAVMPTAVRILVTLTANGLRDV
jgi:hypothetical protein